LWSKHAGFEEGSYIILASGTLPRGGYSASIKFKVPETSYGLYYVQFFQTYQTPITLQFMLRPSLLLIPSSAKPGTKVTIKGSGFPASDYVSVSIQNDIWGNSVDTDTSGSFSASFAVPDIETGSHVVAASSMKLGTEKAQATLQVLSRSVDVVTPPADEPVQTPTDNQNNMGNGSNISVTVAPPPPAKNVQIPKPVIISPRDDSYGWFGEQTVTFNWGAVPEPEDATYTLEVGQNFDFNPPISGMQKTGLTDTSYNMQLAPGKYYWRVKAVDSKGNEGIWAYAPYPFKVGEFPLVPVIIAAALIFVIIMFVKIIKAANRRNDRYYY
jgi:hypothetical protein